MGGLSSLAMIINSNKNRVLRPSYPLCAEASRGMKRNRVPLTQLELLDSAVPKATLHMDFPIWKATFCLNQSSCVFLLLAIKSLSDTLLATVDIY